MNIRRAIVVVDVELQTAFRGFGRKCSAIGAALFAAYLGASACAANASSAESEESSSREPEYESDESCMRGQEECRCFGNGTCDRGLECVDDRCVAAEGDDAPKPVPEQVVAEGVAPDAGADPSLGGTLEAPPATGSLASSVGPLDTGNQAPSVESTAMEIESAPSVSVTPDATASATANTGAGGGSELPTLTDPDADPTSSPMLTEEVLGRACESDADCGDGICLLEDALFAEGTIPGGMCTLRCEQDPNICGEVGRCYTNGLDPSDPDSRGYCHLLCILADGYAECGLDPHRVCARTDADSQLGVCWAECADDSQCPDAHCDHKGQRLCVDEPSVGLADGELCTTNEECMGGYCVMLDEGAASVCSSSCSIRPETRACFRLPDDTNPAESACLATLGSFLLGESPDLYEQGMCYKTCDVDADCAAGWTCLDLLSDEYTLDVGHIGACFPSQYLETTEP